MPDGKRAAVRQREGTGAAVVRMGMKETVLALLICALSATAYAQPTPKNWVVFGPAWLSAFEAKDIEMTDLGEKKDRFP